MENRKVQLGKLSFVKLKKIVIFFVNGGGGDLTGFIPLFIFFEHPSSFKFQFEKE